MVWSGLAGWPGCRKLRRISSLVTICQPEYHRKRYGTQPCSNPTRWPSTMLRARCMSCQAPAGGHGRLPAGWDTEMSDEYEWAPLRLPPEVTRLSASTRLSIEAEYRGWELTRVRLYTDGSRRVLLRRNKSRIDDHDGARRDQPEP